MQCNDTGDPGRTAQFEAYQPVKLANRQKPTIENIGENHCLANIYAKENAASEATDRGVYTHKKRDISCINNSLKPRSNAMSLYSMDAHKRVATAISYALTLGTSKAWEGLSLILMARLSKAERAALAYSALISLDDDTAYKTASVALFGVMNGEVAA